MDVVSACPLRVASIVWQPGPGAFALTVAVVASFTLLPGESPLADDQDDPNEVDGYWNDDDRRSLHVAGDLAPFKPRADVFLVGHAYAPRRELVPSLLTRLLVGDIDKSIAIYGDRSFSLEGELSQPARFVRMSLRWERAAGGPETSNPVGVRADAAPNALGVTPVPNLQPPGTHVTRRGDFVDPIGYGPIAPTWPARLVKLHRHAATWDHRGFHRRPLPNDIDPGYFNAAPPDQQVDEIRSNERVVLENLLPDHARLVTNLRPVTPRGVVEREGGGAEPLRLRCDTLGIDTDRSRCTLTWRGAVALRHPQEAGRVIVTADAAAWSQRPAAARRPPTPTLQVELNHPGSDRAPTLPFVPSAAQALSALPASAVIAGSSSDPDWGDTADFAPAGAPPALPFNPGRDSAFAGPSNAGARALSALQAPPAVPASERARVETWVPPLAGAPPRTPTAPQPPAFAPPVSAEEPPAPPPMIGPLATPEMYARTPDTSVDPPPAGAAPAAAAPPAPSGPELPLDEYPLERCAAIAASIARRPDERFAILERHDLTLSRWSALDRHWTGAIQKQTARGRSTLLRVYDGAYVAQLEAERGPIQVAEYARITVAAERGEEGRALAALGLPRAALIRIQRVWLRKVAEDAALAAIARKELDAAREEDT